MKKDFTGKSIQELHDGMQSKQFSCVELTSFYLEKIDEHNATINAYINIFRDSALEKAKEVDGKIAEGIELKLLEGIPCAIKDNILIKDEIATGGSKILNNYKATYNATVVNKLEDQGVIFLGKTNMDEFAMGGSGETSAYGPTRNPHNIEKVSGGSSSGSAAAVADSQCAFALGSDTGGSVRQPASLCGLVGIKPTYGRVSRFGLMAMASSFDQIGCLSNSVMDSAQILQAISGKDEFDSTSVDKKDDFIKKIKDSVKGKVIGLPKEFFVKGMDENIEKSVLEAVNVLRDLGVEVKEINLPYTKYALSTYYILIQAEISSNLARYDGVKFGYQAESSSLEEMYLKTRSQGFGEEVKRRIMLGTYVLSAGYSDEYYKKAQKLRGLIANDFRKAYEEVDFIITPTSPTLAFNIGEKVDDPITMYLSDIYTVSANVAGLPAISVPCGSHDNLPIGLQIIGKHFDEAGILQLAYNYEKAK